MMIHIIFLLKNTKSIVISASDCVSTAKSTISTISITSSFSSTIPKMELSNADQYLTHYWPITQSTMIDVIGNANMQQGYLTTFVSDRFGCSNSALNLNGGWTHVPSGYYLASSEFTVSVWVYPLKVTANSRIFDFGNKDTAGSPFENIFFSFSNGASNNTFLWIYFSSSTILSVTSSQTFIPGQWQFIAGTFDGAYLKLYLNGNLTATTAVHFPIPYILRTNNFIGKSNWAIDSYSTSYLDDLRFYNKSLSQYEIIDLMNANSEEFSFHQQILHYNTYLSHFSNLISF